MDGDFVLLMDDIDFICSHEFDVRPRGLSRSVSWKAIIGVKFCPMCGEEVDPNV